MAARIDHLMWGAPSLEVGVAMASELFGVAPAPGGSHPRLGTCNALLSLDDEVYLEIIAPDPAQTSTGEFAQQLATLAEPALVTWAAASSELAAIAASARNAGLTAGGPVPSERTTPDGELLRWDLLFLGGHDHAGLVPFFIDWRDTVHPSRVNPAAGRLRSLTLGSPKAAELAALFGRFGLAEPVEEQPEPVLRAVIDAAGGPVVLESSRRSLAMAP